MPDKLHQKHAAITRKQLGEFHHNELAILGTPCADIQQLIRALIQQLSGKWQVGYVDADHKAEPLPGNSTLLHGGVLEFTDQISSRKFVCRKQFNNFQNRALYNDLDLVLINGNHFNAQSQIVIVDERKPLQNKLDKLTDVKLILLTEAASEVPAYLLEHGSQMKEVPVCSVDDIDSITGYIQRFLNARLPKVNGLVLAGGKSTRMQTDKGSISYFGKSQRLHTYELLSELSTETYVSYADEQAVNQQEGVPYITDKFLGLGPLSGILSAFQQQPDVAWLTVACDLPYLSAQTLQYLIANRNPSKMATAFLDPEGKFPEPLITIWEPRAYQALLQFLSQGYSCPRKALINSDIELLQAPNVQDMQNVNHPEERDKAMQHLKVS